MQEPVTQGQTLKTILSVLAFLTIISIAIFAISRQGTEQGANAEENISLPVTSGQDKETEQNVTYVDYDGEQIALYAGEPWETENIVGVTWGESFSGVRDLLQSKLQTLDYRRLRMGEQMIFEVEMLEKPWEAYFEFNDDDSLYRLDMTLSERIIGADEEKDFLVFLSELINSTYEKYGNVDGLLYPVESTTDYESFYNDLSTMDNLRLLQSEDIISVMYNVQDMRIWLVILREDFEQATKLEDEKTGNVLNGGLELKKSLRDIYSIKGAAESFSEFDDGNGETLKAFDRDSLYSIYIGFINTRFPPKKPIELDVTYEDPSPFEDIMPSEYRIDQDEEGHNVDQYIKNNEKAN